MGNANRRKPSSLFFDLYGPRFGLAISINLDGRRLLGKPNPSIANVVVAYLPHRALAAAAAMRWRSAGVMLAARALPPLRPPKRPSATAAGFFSGLGVSDGNGCPVDWATMFAAIWFRSVLERLRMPQLCASQPKIQAEFQTVPLPINPAK